MTQPSPAPAPQPPAPQPTPAPAPPQQGQPVPTPPPTPAPPAPAPPTPAPQPAPQPIGPPQPVPPGPQTPPIVPQPGMTGGDGGGESGPGITFPAATPWRQMSPEHQVAYWQHQARRHESRVNAMGDYDQAKADQQRYHELLQTTQTEHERAIAQARSEGEQVASHRANQALVEAYVRAAAASRQIDDESVNELLETLDRSKFITAQGQVDTARIYGLVNRMGGHAPVPQVMVPAVPAVTAGPPQTAPLNGGAPATGPAAPAGAPPATWPTAAPAGVTAWPGQQVQQPQYAVPPPPAGWPAQPPAAPAAVAPGAAPAVPQPGQRPDMGQGQFAQAPASGLEAGKAAARARYGKRQQQNAPQTTNAA